MKRVLFFLLVFVLAFGAACGGDDDDDADTGVEEGETETVVTEPADDEETVEVTEVEGDETPEADMTGTPEDDMAETPEADMTGTPEDDETPAADLTGTPEEDETPAMDMTETPEADGTPAAGEDIDVAIGEPAEVDELTITVESVSFMEGDQLIGPEEGNQFLAVELTIENAGEDPVRVLRLLSQMQIEGETDEVYDVSLLATSLAATQGEGLPETRIGAGEEVTGMIGFEVPEDASGLVLVIESADDPGGDPVRIDLEQ